MADEIPVSYNTSGVQIPETIEDGHYYSTILSTYFYNKQNTISNTNHITNTADFTSAELTNYGLSVNNNGEINISTTKKLLKYLKSLIHKTSLEIDSNIQSLKDYVDGELDKKLNASAYVVDTELKNNSSNPVRNSVVANKIVEIEDGLGAKSNIDHTHNMIDVLSLNSTIEGINNSISTKAENSDLTKHTSNKDNPHNVNLNQLGFTDSGWVSGMPNLIVEDSMKLDDTILRCRKFGKLAVLEVAGTMIDDLKKDKKAGDYPIFTLKSGYRPNGGCYDMIYHKGGVITLNINSNGRVSFGKQVSTDEYLRFRVCYYTA